MSSIRIKSEQLLIISFSGIFLFIGLYILAALIYPGGSNLYPTAKGFSLLHNFWCDLLNFKAKNGLINPSRSIAITAMSILCLSLGIIWYFLPTLFENKIIYKRTISFTGIPSMLIALFLFTSYHDLVINLAGLLGTIAYISTFAGLYSFKYYKLLGLGVTCLIFSLVNYFIYQTSIYLLWLPVTQKITFAIGLLWFGLINFALYQRTKNQI